MYLFIWIYNSFFMLEIDNILFIFGMFIEME